jgi:hypothetical protein
MKLMNNIERLDRLMTTARQRYLNAGGNPHQTSSGIRGDDYLTEAERQEALSLARSMFNEEYIRNYLENKQPRKLKT